MIHTPITVVYNTYSIVATSAETYRRRDHLDRFVEELRRYTRQAVPLVFSRLCEALPLDGFIILNPFNGIIDALEEVDAGQRVQVAARLVPINMFLTHTLENEMESRSMVAAIDSHSIHSWELPRRPPAPVYQLYGQRRLGSLIGARPVPPGGSERYCRLQSTSHEGLPHLLADYLAAFEKSQGVP
jgi:hypothetical protein